MLAIFDAHRDKGTRGSHGGSAKIVRASSSCPPHGSAHIKVYVDVHVDKERRRERVRGGPVA